MRNSIFKSVIVLLLVTMSSLSFAGSLKTDKNYPVKNLIMGMSSENEGLRRSCIFYSGIYKYSETAELLVSQYKKETNPRTRLLIVHALFRIEDADAMDKVYKLIENDEDSKVKRIGTAIYETFKVGKYSNEEFIADNR